MTRPFLKGKTLLDIINENMECTWRPEQAHCRRWGGLVRHRGLGPSHPLWSSLGPATWTLTKGFNSAAHLWKTRTDSFVVRSHPQILQKNQVVLRWVGNESCNSCNLGTVHNVDEHLSLAAWFKRRQGYPPFLFCLLFQERKVLPKHSRTIFCVLYIAL